MMPILHTLTSPVVEGILFIASPRECDSILTMEYRSQSKDDSVLFRQAP